MDVVRKKMIRSNPPPSCTRALSDPTRPPDGDTLHHGPSERESRQSSDKTERKTTRLRLPLLTGRGTPHTTAFYQYYLFHCPYPCPSSRLRCAIATHIPARLAREAPKRHSDEIWSRFGGAATDDETRPPSLAHQRVNISGLEQ